MLFLYLAVLSIGIYWVFKVLAPEMAKPLLPKGVAKVVSNDGVQDDLPENRLEKLEILLAEKNKNIVLLQTQLKIFYAQIRDFDKVKTLLEGEIQHLREQNRIFRSELGLPSLSSLVEQKENSIT